MRGLGIEVAGQRGVTFDIGSRPNKSPRAFCAPVRVPGEVYLVVAPVGGWDDFATLFHEGGHTEHAANIDPELPFEFRCLGDNSITETYAFLIQHLVEDPEWLERRLGVDDPSDADRPRQGPAARLPAALCGKARLRARAPRRGRRRSRLERARPPLLGAARRHAADRVADRDLPRRRRRGLLLRVLPAGVGARDPSALAPARRFGPAWFESAEAGEVLRGLWRDGQRLDAEELLGELTGERLDFGVVLDRSRARLAPPGPATAERTATESTSSCLRMRVAAPPGSRTNASRMCSVPTRSAPSADASRPARSTAAWAGSVSGSSPRGRLDADAHHRDDRGTDARVGHAERGQDVGRATVLLAQEPKQHVLGADVACDATTAPPLGR